MGHDHHFLSRLDRFDWRHAETALGLYRDAQAVQEVLRRSSAPPDAERVAISLDDPNEGPFVLVSADGHFVTCLGRGMRTSLPVVKRAELDMIFEHLDRHRGACRLFRADSHCRVVLERVLSQGEVLLAEDVAELRAVQPLLETDVLTSIAQLVPALLDALPDALLAVTHSNELARMLTSSYYRATWIYRNNLLVVGLGSPRVIRDVFGGRSSMSLACTWLGLSHMVIAGGWAASLLGPTGFDAFARSTREKLPQCIEDGVYNLCCLAARHPETIEEADQVLSALHDTVAGGCHPLAKKAQWALELLRDGKLKDTAMAAARAQLASTRPEFVPQALRRSDIDGHQALNWVVQSVFDAYHDWEHVGTSLLYGMESARWEAEQLCLPRQWSRDHARMFSPQHAWKLLKCIRSERHIGKRVTHPALPGRNDPCPCGSGKKYKRCCSHVEAVPKRTGAAIAAQGQGLPQISRDDLTCVERNAIQGGRGTATSERGCTARRHGER